MKNILISENLLSKENCYSLPTNYDYVENLYFFKRRGHLEIIRYLLKNTCHKIVYFCSSNDKFIEAAKEFEGVSNRICSIHTKNKIMQDLNQPDCIEINGEYITFPERLLISTKCMDSGIDLIDPEIKHLVCDISDLESAKQCIGRKRVIDKNDTVNLYIRDYLETDLNLLLQRENNEFEPMDLFLHNMGKFKELYSTEREMYYGFYVPWGGDQLPRVNYMKYKKSLLDIELIQKAIDISYRKLFLNYMGGGIEMKVQEVSFASVVEKEKLLVFLEENKDRELSEDEKEILINLVNLRDGRNRKLRTIGLLNEYFKERHIDYVILRKRRNDLTRTSCWVIRFGHF